MRTIKSSSLSVRPGESENARSRTRVCYVNGAGAFEGKLRRGETAGKDGKATSPARKAAEHGRDLEEVFGKRTLHQHAPAQDRQV